MDANRKSILIAALATISGILFWVFLYHVFYRNLSGEIRIRDLAILAALFFILAESTIFFYLSAREARMVFFNLGIVSSVILVLFGISRLDNMIFFLLFISGFGVFVFFMVWGWYIIRFESDDRLKIRFTGMTSRSLSTFFTASFLLISLVYFLSPSLSRTLRDITVPRPLFDISIKPLEIVLRGVIPTFRFDAPLEELLFTLSTLESARGGEDQTLTLSPQFFSRLKNQELSQTDLGFDDIFKNQQAGEIIQAEAQRQFATASKKELEKIREEYTKQFGVDIVGGETVGDFLYAFFSKQLNGILLRYRDQLPVAIAFGLFLTLKTSSLPFKWMMILVSLFIFNVLKRASFLKVEERDAKKEVLTFE